MSGDEEGRNRGKIAEGRDAKGRFAAGNRGRPPGTRCKATRAVEGLLEGEAERLTRKAVELALEGDTAALRLCLERIAPARKDAPVRFDLPEVATVADMVDASAAVLRAVAAGEVSPGEAQAVAALLQAHGKTLELADLEQRIQRLEEERRR